MKNVCYLFIRTYAHRDGPSVKKTAVLRMIATALCVTRMDAVLVVKMLSVFVAKNPWAELSRWNRFAGIFHALRRNPRDSLSGGHVAL